ncbi:MAG: mechanosensitive ion channel family protein [Calditrichia bacterium]
MQLQDSFNTVSDKLQDWLSTLIEMLPNIAVAIIIMILFYIVSRIAQKWIPRILGKFSRSDAVNRLISNIVSLIILVAGLFIALGVLQLDKTVTSLLAGVGIIGLALSFAFQDMATNFVSGVMIAIRNPFRVGDIIESNDYYGTVDKITLRTTNLRTFQGQIVLIPNKEVYQNPIINYSITGSRRIDLAVGVSYGDDLSKVKDLTLQVINEIPELDKNRNVDMYYEEFGNSSINFKIRFWVAFRKQTDFLAARSNAIMKIKAVYDENDITIPFPIRTLDFGIKGGEKLSEMMDLSSAENGNGK